MSPVVRTLGKALKADTHLWYLSSRKQNLKWHAAWMALRFLVDATAGHLNRGYVWDLIVSNRRAVAL